MSTNLRRAVARYVETTQPAAKLRHEAAAARVYDDAGRITPQAAAPFRTPLALHWGSGDARYKAVARPGRAVLIRARCDTAPSGGPCVVALEWESEVTGLTWLGSVTIPDGGRFGEATIAAEVATLPAGAWVRAGAPSPANGASGVDVELTIEPI